MDIKNVIAALHPLERRVLPLIQHAVTFSELVSRTGLKDVEVMRALQWLQNKKLISVQEDTSEIAELGENGKRYAGHGLPERAFLEAIGKGQLSHDAIGKKAKLTDQEMSICIGTLKAKAAITLEKIGDKLIVEITDNGKELLRGESHEELLLRKQFPLSLGDLREDEKFALRNLARRKGIVCITKAKLRTAKPTELGKKAIAAGIGKQEVIDRLTPEHLRSGDWKEKSMRHYDVRINVPQVHPGRRHFVNEVISYARRIWLDMGFREMNGTFVNTSFWNFDALFTAQDHPVRDLHDTFFIEEPSHGRLPGQKLVKRVMASHEKGGTVGSKGWQYHWKPEEAQRNVLRTHTTVLSAQTLAKLAEVPGKYFALGRCFRNETLDWKHLFEFNQTEGIVIDPDANFRHLLGYLKEFFRKLGYADARFRPAYFPYTEPSVEIDVFHPVHKQWMELGGAGMFRPEVVEPLLGRDIPVLAWGPGFDRIYLEHFNITDMRDIYKNDVGKLRNMKVWMG